MISMMIFSEKARIFPFRVVLPSLPLVLVAVFVVAFSFTTGSTSDISFLRAVVVGSNKRDNTRLLQQQGPTQPNDDPGAADDDSSGGVCPPLDEPTLIQKRVRSLALDRRFVERMNLTLAYQYIMLEKEPNDNADQIQRDYNLDYYQYWEEINDATLIAKQNNKGVDPGVCHVAFRATIDLIDNLQNVYPFSVPLENSDCAVRDGFKSGLFTSYYDQLSQSIAECVSQCQPNSSSANTSGTTTGQEGYCPLVFSGLSQAGGVATIASIVFRQYNPMVITFGAMRAIENDNDNYPCTDLDPTRHFRFVTSNGDGEYDVVANLRYPLMNLKHVGHTIYMDETNYPLLYLGLNEDKQRLPPSYGIHLRDSYQERINQMLNYSEQACYPIPLSKWPTGHVCNYDDECNNNNNCINYQCTKTKTTKLLDRGSYCENNSDCQSGRCRRGRWYYLDFRKRCRA